MSLNSAFLLSNRFDNTLTNIPDLVVLYNAILLFGSPFASVTLFSATIPVSL